MKKNQRSIDGFTPRRINRNTSNKSSSTLNDAKLPISNRHSKAVKNIEKMANTKSSSSNLDVDYILSNLKVDDNLISSKNNRTSRKESKLIQKLDKVNKKRSRKGRKALTMSSFKIRLIVRRIVAVLIAVLLVRGAVSLYNITKGVLNISNNGGFSGLFFKKDLKKDEENRTNVLIFGTSPVGWEGEDLSDSIMVLSVNQVTKKAHTISLPRDLYVKHNCSILGTVAGRLNESYFCGKYSKGFDPKTATQAEKDEAEKLGQNEIASTVSKITGLDIHYKVHANWQVVIQTIDAVGGIDVKVEVWDGSPEMYDYATKVRYKNGEQAHMNGEQALAFSRARGSAGGYGLSGGNFDRERNQQKVLKATLAKVNDSKFNLDALNKVITALGDNVKTTFSTDEYQTLISLATENIKAENVKSLPLVGDEGSFFEADNISGASVVIPVAGLYDYSAIQNFIAKKTISNEVSEEKAKVVILNGTQISGLAAEQKVKLSKEGYNITEIDSAPTSDYKKTEVFVINSEKTATIKKLEDKFKVRSSADVPSDLGTYSAKSDIIIVLGDE